MERFIPILDIIRVRLREILTRTENSMNPWDMVELMMIGEDLVKLASDVQPRLIEVEHRVLSQSIREAGLGIRHRAKEVQGRSLNRDDEEYFKSVHEALGNLCEKIETGEYYEALRGVASSRKRRQKSHLI